MNRNFLPSSNLWIAVLFTYESYLSENERKHTRQIEKSYPCAVADREKWGPQINRRQKKSIFFAQAIQYGLHAFCFIIGKNIDVYQLTGDRFFVRESSNLTGFFNRTRCACLIDFIAIRFFKHIYISPSMQQYQISAVFVPVVNQIVFTLDLSTFTKNG